MAINLNAARWRGAFTYIEALPIAEKRRFYARAIKYFLEPAKWEESIREPKTFEHENMRQMLLAFNDHRHDLMAKKPSSDVEFQWQIVRYIKKGKKRRQRKSQISRFTYEMMQIIRLCHPTSRSQRKPMRDRVRCMSQFQSEMKGKFFGKHHTDDPED